MKKIIIIHSNMEIGGAETSLISLLQSLDYKKYKVDLLLLNKEGDLLKFIPKEVNIIENDLYKQLMIPIKEVISNKYYKIALSRIRAKFKSFLEYKINGYNDLCYITKQYSHKFSLRFLPVINEKYEIGISFIDPHYILQKKIKSDVKLGWLHTDFGRIKTNKKADIKMWDECDYIVCVSDECKNAFDRKYPKLLHKSIVIENILNENIINFKSNEFNINHEMLIEKNSITLCSVGRFSEAKNFDNIPDICKKIIDSGCNIKWYIVGYGGDEKLIKSKIKELKMEDRVIMLGKKINPYPYIKACDIYVQPSRYEGKAVTVREAQILNKPVVITNFATANSQLTDGFDGIIVPMDNEGCAKGIVKLIKDKELQSKLIENTKKTDYSNKKEIKKIYNILGE